MQLLGFIISSLLVSANAVAALFYVPRYVLDYAPLVMLDEKEEYYPYDIGEFLRHTQVRDDNGTLVVAPGTIVSLDNLDQVNGLDPNGGYNHFLTSIDVMTKVPAWCLGVKPDESGKTSWVHSATVILNDKGNGVLDAFYFYFFAWHHGKTLNGHDIGIHVGGWEHNMIRFKNGLPQAVWFSQYGKGVAYTYETLDKYGLRPIVFAARGSHALYATASQMGQGEVPTFDSTSQGISWDPLWKSYYIEVHTGSRTSDGGTEMAFVALENPYNELLHTPTAWLNYRGHWGDAQLPITNPAQEEAFNDFKWVAGPRGPRFEQLDRPNVCRGEPGDMCEIRSSIYNSKVVKHASLNLAMIPNGNSTTPRKYRTSRRKSAGVQP